MTHGQRVDVGGYHLYLESAGTGSPTVLFECGMECGAASLANLATEVQQFTHTVLYDWAGLGQSDPAPTPRTAQDVARALEQDWLAMQKELVALSHNGTHIIDTESDHSIQDCQPELVVDVIRQLVQDIRASRMAEETSA